MISHRGISVITPLPFGGGEGGGANWLLVCEVTPIGLLTRGVSKHFSHAGEFFLSQSAQSSRSFLAHSLELTEGLWHTEFTERYYQRWVLSDGC